MNKQKIKKTGLAPAMGPGFQLTGKEKSINVDIKKSIDAWSIYKLVDGSELKVKPIIALVKRVVGKYDHRGEPIYQIQTGMVVEMKAASKLKKSRRGKR